MFKSILSFLVSAETCRELGNQYSYYYNRKNTDKQKTSDFFFFLLGPLEYQSCKSNCHHKIRGDRATAGAMNYEEHFNGKRGELLEAECRPA